MGADNNRPPILLPAYDRFPEGERPLRTALAQLGRLAGIASRSELPPGLTIDEVEALLIKLLGDVDEDNV